MTSYSITIKWNGKSYQISELTDETSVKDLKYLIERETNVRPIRQKLLNLKLKGKVPTDDILLKDLKVKPNMKVMMMGSVEEELKDVLAGPPDNSDVLDDFDIGEDEEIKLEFREEHQQKIERRVWQYPLKQFNEPRPGKKLLVLDIDYTLYDHRSTAENVIDLMRPFLHDFLMQAYEDYDIGIWSATSMRWIEVKMKELGVTNNPNYKIVFFMDHGAMITVNSPKYGVVDTKALGVIWGKFPDNYSSENTVMIDDLRRNFLMNPQSGLKILPFRNSRVAGETDVELKSLAAYLKNIAKLDSFSKLNHKLWKTYRKRRHHREPEEDKSSNSKPESEAVP